MPVEDDFGSQQKLTSDRVYYADVAAHSPDRRHENVLLISNDGDGTAVAINDAVLASVSPLCRDILVQHQNMTEPPEDRYQTEI